MTEHVYYILTGRKVLLQPKDLEDPLYPGKLRAYREQRRQTEAIAAAFAKSGFNLKTVFQAWAVSDFYRADGLATAVKEPCRRAELDDAGVVRMLSPEQVERKIGAVFGEKWGKLNGQMAMLYGGIDSKEVTDRATDPSGAMGAIQRILSNEWRASMSPATSPPRRSKSSQRRAQRDPRCFRGGRPGDSQGHRSSHEKSWPIRRG